MTIARHKCIDFFLIKFRDSILFNVPKRTKTIGDVGYIPTSPGLLIIALHDDLFPASDGCELLCCPGSGGCCCDVTDGGPVVHCAGDTLVYQQ